MAAAKALAAARALVSGDVEAVLAKLVELLHAAEAEAARAEADRRAALELAERQRRLIERLYRERWEAAQHADAYAALARDLEARVKHLTDELARFGAGPPAAAGATDDGRHA